MGINTTEFNAYGRSKNMEPYQDWTPEFAKKIFTRLGTADGRKDFDQWLEKSQQDSNSRANAAVKSPPNSTHNKHLNPEDAE